MANKFQVKRTSVSGRTPNTTSSGNTHYIDTGELALNLTDGKMFSSNGSAYFEVGANLENLQVSSTANLNQVQLANVVVSNTVTIDNDKELAFKTLSGSKARIVLQNDDNFVFYSTNASGGARVVYSLYANSTTSNLQIHTPLQPLNGIVANGSIGSAGQTLTSNGSGVYWAAGAGTGTVTQVDTGDGLTGGPINSTGTISVVANNGIIANTAGVFANPGTGVVVNATGIHVNSSYIGTLAANSATYLDGNTALDLRNYSDTAAGTAYSNAITFAANATNISSGTLNAARLPATVVQNTDSRTLSGNLVISGTYFNPSSNTVQLGNTTQRWVLNANTGSFSGAVSGITTLAAGNTTITGFANITSTIQGGSSLTIAGALSGVTTAAMGNTTITGFANVTGSIQGGSSLTIAGAASGITTLAAGNTTITGFANISTSVNSALLTVGASFIANTTGVYHTGTINAASHTTSGIVANTSGVYPSSNTVGTALGSSVHRWVLNANSGNYTGQVTITDTWDTADGAGAVYLNAATGNRIEWNTNGVAAPAATTRSVGTKLVLYPQVTATSVDYGIGVETGHLWLSASETSGGIKWYANTTQLAVANTTGITVGSGGLFPTSNTTAASLGSSTQRWTLNASTGSFAGAVSGITTLAAGNTTITGFANVSSSVNSASFTVGTSFVANTTAITLGTIGAASNGVVINNNLITVGNTSVNTEITPAQIRANQNDTVSAPSYSWSGNTTTGFYRPATDTIGVAVAGVEELRVNSSILFVNTNISVGNTTSGYINLGRPTASLSMGYQQEKIFTIDGTTYGAYFDTLVNNTAYTASRTHYGVDVVTVANTLSQNTLGNVINTDVIGIASFAYNAESTGGESRVDDLTGVFSDVRNYGSGVTANSVNTAYGVRAFARSFGPGVITTAIGFDALVGAGNNTVTGNVTTAYAVRSSIDSNTAMTIGTGYLYYGDYGGTTTTSKFGVYITGESNNYFSSNVSIAGALAISNRLVANGTSGTAGQVLTSNSTGTYWSTISTGTSVTVADDTATNGTRYLAFANQTSGTLSTIYTDSTGLTFNPSTGTVTAAVFSATSDERQKTNINIIQDPITKLNKLKGVSFNYRNNNIPGVGVIAQDVETIFPELVSINSDGYKSVAYDGLIGLLIEAMKDQQNQINQLMQEVDNLRGKDAN